MFRNRWVRRGLAGFLTGLAFLVVGIFVDRHLGRRAGEERFAAIVTHLDAADPRWRFDEIEADRGRLPQFVAALAAPRFDKHPGLAADRLYTAPPNRALDDDTYAALDAALAANAEALAIAGRFADFPTGHRPHTLARNPLDTQIPGVHDTRLVFGLLDLAAERAGRDGRGGAALGHVRPMVHSGRSLAGEPSMISALVRTACLQRVAVRVERTLALSVPGGRLPEVQAVLAAEAEADLFWDGLRGDRAMMDRMFADLRAGTLSIGDLDKRAPDPLAGLGGWWYEPHLAADHATFLEITTRACEARALPDHEQRAALAAAEQMVAALPRAAYGSLLTRLLTPAFTKVHDSSTRTKARLRCAVAGIAVERFRQQHGRWPATLAEVPKDLLGAVPNDPFDGRPLRYARRADGVTVYSVGLDGADDGGRVGAGTTMDDPGHDLGFRLYDPAHRGLPAVPAPPRRPGSVPFGPEVGFEPADGPPIESGPEPRPAGVE